MRRPILAAIVSAGFLLSGTVQAMEIRQFDKMDLQDQGRYVGQLVGGAERTLTEAGHADQAAQVEKLFTTKDPGDKDSHGIIEFEMNLALAREADARRVIDNPSAPRLEVEHAMIVTLKKNGIVLPRSFMHANDDFRPQLRPRQ
jgi:hypothetical protein